MAETTYFPRRLILAGAMISGVLLALAVHMLGARYGLDLGGLWRSDTPEFMPAGAAIAWWLIATVGFLGRLFHRQPDAQRGSRQIPQRMRQFLIVVGVLMLAGAGQAAAAPSPVSTISGVLAGLAALCLGAVMAFCGAYFSLRKVLNGDMRRRDVFGIVGGAVAWPLAARAQSSDRVRRIGLLPTGYRQTDPEGQARIARVRRDARQVRPERRPQLRSEVRWPTPTSTRSGRNGRAGRIFAGRIRGQQQRRPHDTPPEAEQDHTDHFRSGLGPGRRRICRQPRAPRRQHHRLSEFRAGGGRQMAGTVEGGRA